jgi:hypothetical protein
MGIFYEVNNQTPIFLFPGWTDTALFRRRKTKKGVWHAINRIRDLLLLLGSVGSKVTDTGY